MDYQQLKEYFEGAELPNEFFLNPAVKITDVQKFVETQMVQIEAHGVKAPAYGRLIEFVEKLKALT